ncbi:MAG: hypothetical protein ABFQ82_04830 [Thermodesulfobacteriota bacterium]
MRFIILSYSRNKKKRAPAVLAQAAMATKADAGKGAILEQWYNGLLKPVF